MNTFEKIQKIIMEVLGIKDPAQITMDTNLVHDCGCDSLDAVEIITEIEDQFDIRVDDDSVAKISTVADLVQATEEALK